ncbi:hypothetical protein G4B88_000863 [Cannabis sativa]|uniref:Bifunctional inhibitor/plant lipid transfer protein/seed storage helical domain-containing protein n=1 Tax=Cannabis sativa TaxID=3483 RepID=A0A7J6DX43_CANSA|nr:hypothetical protein G4B88_000863 [Cannabis sativa]
MAKTTSTVATIFFLVMTCAWAQQAPAQAPMDGSMGPTASAPGPDCMTVLMGMADCLSYVQTGSNLTTPDKPCCSELKSLVDNNPICLCEFLAHSGDSGFQIDISKAKKLPSVCKVDTPPPSTCALVGIPVGSPTSSDGPSASSPMGTVSAPTAESPGAAKDDGNRGSTSSIVAVLLGFAVTISFFSSI